VASKRSRSEGWVNTSKKKRYGPRVREGTIKEGNEEKKLED